MRESHESREQWARRHHCAQTDFEELAWIYCQDTDKLRAEVERLRAALVRQDNIDSRLRAEIGNLREHVESKNRLLPSLISEGKQMETERAVAAEREVERLRARVEVLERVRKAANDVAVIDNPLGQGGMAAELELRAALLAAKEGEDGN